MKKKYPDIIVEKYINRYHMYVLKKIRGKRYYIAYSKKLPNKNKLEAVHNPYYFSKPRKKNSYITYCYDDLVIWSAYKKITTFWTEQEFAMEYFEMLLDN